MTKHRIAFTLTVVTNKSIESRKHCMVICLTSNPTTCDKNSVMYKVVLYVGVLYMSNLNAMGPLNRVATI